MRKRPTVENVAEEMLRELARRNRSGEQEPNIDTLAFLVSQKLTSLSQQQLDAGRTHLVQRRLLGKCGDRYSIDPAGEAYLASIDEEKGRIRNRVIKAAIALLGIAAGIWGYYMSR